jgi:hypothetical protein
MSRVLLMLAALSIGGCGLVKFDTTVSGMGVIPGQVDAVKGPFAAGSFDAAGSLAQSISTNGTSAGAISSAQVTGGTLKVINPTQMQDSLIYISSFSISVAAPGVNPQVIATIPAGTLTNKTTTVALTTMPVELKPYIAAGSITMTPTMTFSSHPASDIPIELTLTIHASL